ncbi:hypothetical protein [Chryseobacterium sp. MMS23-Vi53]|uniref:hypothetical protein n=1 Tax=Chryseobacterium sp. MMS23-Vi53 TaxID=3386644 RepID=UPI0039EBB815
MNQKIKHLLFAFFILFSISGFCQNNKYKQIDELLLRAQNSRKRFKNLDQLKYAEQAYILSKETGDSQKITESCYSIASALSFLELPKKSFEYIQKATQQPYYQKSKLMQAQIKEVKAFNYYGLGLTSQFYKELPEIIELLKNQNDKESAILRQRAYLNLGVSKPDSVKIYSQFSLRELKKFPEKEVYAELSDIYKYIGTDCLDKKSDSALYYFEKSIKINQKYGENALFMDFTNIGDFYSQKENLKVAINYYLKAIENIKQQSISPYNFINNDLYRKISELYGKLGDFEKKSQYQKQYILLQNKLNSEQSKNIDLASKIVLADQESEYKTAQRKKFMLIGLGILVFIIICFIIYRLLKKRIMQKEDFIHKVTDNLSKKDEIISIKNTEAEQLREKVNDAYLEVMNLAKENDPSFYFRFQEVYPEFQKCLLDYRPSLKASELILCAYTFLGFNTKDVATFTFKSINTVRNRKQNLRKKFNIPTEENMENWLKNLIK